LQPECLCGVLHMTDYDVENAPLETSFSSYSIGEESRVSKIGQVLWLFLPALTCVCDSGYKTFDWLIHHLMTITPVCAVTILRLMIMLSLFCLALDPRTCSSRIGLCQRASPLPNKWSAGSSARLEKPGPSNACWLVNCWHPAVCPVAKMCLKLVSTYGYNKIIPLLLIYRLASTSVIQEQDKDYRLLPPAIVKVV